MSATEFGGLGLVVTLGLGERGRIERNQSHVRHPLLHHRADMICFISAFSRSRIGFGVPARATSMCQATTS